MIKQKSPFSKIVKFLIHSDPAIFYFANRAEIDLILRTRKYRSSARPRSISLMTPEKFSNLDRTVLPCKLDSRHSMYTRLLTFSPLDPGLPVLREN